MGCHPVKRDPRVVAGVVVDTGKVVAAVWRHLFCQR